MILLFFSTVSYISCQLPPNPLGDLFSIQKRENDKARKVKIVILKPTPLGKNLQIVLHARKKIRLNLRATLYFPNLDKLGKLEPQGGDLQNIPHRDLVCVGMSENFKSARQIQRFGQKVLNIVPKTQHYRNIFCYALV